MSFSDIFKKNFLENFTGTVSIQLVIVTLVVALLFSLVVFYVYKFTSKNTIYSKSFNVTMSLISIITAGVVLSMQANIVVSLGMVGALSIVRFRTAVKEPRDLFFLFWSISNGIIIGAGVYSLVFMMAIVLTIGLLVFDLLPVNRIPYLLVVNLNDTDIVFQLSCKDTNALVEDLRKIKEITSFNLLSQDGECQF